MNARLLFATLLVLLAALGMTPPVRGLQGGFVIAGADATSYLETTSSAPLNARLDEADPRLTVQYANKTAEYPILPPPGALQSLLTQTRPRVSIQYANAAAEHPLLLPPVALHTLLVGVSERIVVQYANANRFHTLSYPVELMDDSTPPIATGITSSDMNSSSAMITWTTDEFADSKVLYGTSPTSLTESVHDPFHVKEHELVLSGLSPGVAYYYKVESRDLSDNLFTSNLLNFTFQSESKLYLPLTQR